jgi:hypothetical protein
MILAPLTDDVDRDDLIVRRDSGGESGVVRQAQVAPGPVDGGGHLGESVISNQWGRSNQFSDSPRGVFTDYWLGTDY